MAISAVTPRDRLQRLVDLGKKTLRYWWLVAVFAVVGGALSFAFALTRARNYQSWSTLFYQERIQSNVLQNREEVVQRNIGDRYRELLLARAQLEKIINDPKLNPYPEIADPELAIDKLRTQIRFEARGGNVFRIDFTDRDPDTAKAVVERLTKMLQDKDEQLRDETAQRTVNVATSMKEEAAAELKKREQELATFLAAHPEFAQDPNQQGEGASIRAIRNQKPTTTGNPRLYALERQRERIQARLDAPPDAPVVRVPAPPSPEKQAADAAVAEAQRELSAAQHALDDALQKYTDKHPAVVNAQERVAAAQQKLRHAQAAEPPDEAPIAPATPADRTKLQKQLSEIESQIADEQKRTSANKPSEAAAADAATNWVVKLETQHADLRRAVNEQRARVQSLADSVFRAQMDAETKTPETGSWLSVVDGAFRPARPTGPGKTIFLLAGMVLFLGLGGLLAVGLAVIDDRLYRRADIDQLGLAVLAVIPPPASKLRAPKHRDEHEEDEKEAA